MNKPKILLVADTYYPKIDGILRFMEEFIKRSRANFDLSLLVPGLDHKNIKGIKTNFFDVSKYFKLSGYQSIKSSFKNLKIVKQAIKESDIVFVQGPALASYISIYYAHKYKKKIAFYIHVVSWELFAKFFPSFINKLVKRIFINSYNKCNLFIIPYFGLVKELSDARVKSYIQIARLGEGELR